MAVNKHKAIHWFVIVTFVALYLFTSVISMIHVVSFFDMANVKAMAIALAIAFELGAAASLASIIVLDKMNKWIVWSLFVILTAMQAMGNAYNAYVNLENFTGWIELFGLTDLPMIAQKRVLAIISGAIIPIVALGFIKALVDYIKPSVEADANDSANDAANDVVNDVATNEPHADAQLLHDVLYSSPVTSPEAYEPSPAQPVEQIDPSVDEMLDELAAPAVTSAAEKIDEDVLYRERHKHGTEPEHKYSDVRAQ